MEKLKSKNNTKINFTSGFEILSIINYHIQQNNNLRTRKFQSKILVNDQLDAQLFYFVIRLLQSSTCFEQRRAHHQEVKFYQYSIWYSHSV